MNTHGEVEVQIHLCVTLNNSHHVFFKPWRRALLSLSGMELRFLGRQPHSVSPMQDKVFRNVGPNVILKCYITEIGGKR
jgi:hypothetical protein